MLMRADDWDMCSLHSDAVGRPGCWPDAWRPTKMAYITNRNSWGLHHTCLSYKRACVWGGKYMAPQCNIYSRALKSVVGRNGYNGTANAH
jgi:hypothetical protein